mgnify:CR=1 FL=1
MFLILFFVFLTGLFLTYTLYLFTSRASDKKRALLKERLADAIRTSAHSTDMDVQLAREELMSEIPWMNRVLIKLQVSSKLKQMIDQADSHITVMRLILFSLTAGVLAFLAVSMISDSYLLMGFCAFIATALPFLHIHSKRKKRLKKFLQLLPDALDLMSRGLSAGHAFTEALQMVATEMPEPIATEFRIVFEEQKLGLSTKVALDRLTERVPLTDLRLCVTAMHIQRETGGNLAEILEKVSQTIRERFKLMEDFRTLTTSSRGSAWILCGLPIAIIFLLTVINPDYMFLLLHDQRGHYVIGAAFVLQLLGILTIKKILAIKV